MYKTTQEAFDAMAKHLLTQNAVSRFPGEVTCSYRGPDGLKCAVGALIPDEIYRPKLEGMHIFAEGFAPVLNKIIGKSVDVDILYQVQRVHDYMAPNVWEMSLYEIAKDYGLTTEALN